MLTLSRTLAMAAMAAILLSGCAAPEKATAEKPAKTADPVTTFDDEETDVEPAEVIPDASAYTVKVKTTSKQCFGSAGCNVTVRLGLQLNDPSADGIAADLTVKVTGDESGPIIQTLSLDEDGQFSTSEISLSTRSSSSKVKAKITEVTAP